MAKMDVVDETAVEKRQKEQDEPEETVFGSGDERLVAERKVDSFVFTYSRGGKNFAELTCYFDTSVFQALLSITRDDDLYQKMYVFINSEGEVSEIHCSGNNYKRGNDSMTEEIKRQVTRLWRGWKKKFVDMGIENVMRGAATQSMPLPDFSRYQPPESE